MKMHRLGKTKFILYILTLLLSAQSAFADLCVNDVGYTPWDYSSTSIRIIRDSDGMINYSSTSFGGNGSVSSSFGYMYPDYGGVSLSKTADLMLNINDVAGATFDEATGQIILFGKRPISLLQMNLDDLSVAVRSVYGYDGQAPQDPGVSIGTESSPIPGQMKVRYDGQTYQTGFGYTMFESDRLLKNLTLGRDNITGQPVTSAVTGYSNLADRYQLSNSLPPSNQTVRMWFVPKEISLVQSSDNSSMLFNTASMELLTETKFKDNVTSDPVAEAFASHFTQHYDEFADERPILGELKRQGKITAVVKWIRDNNIPFDLSYFDNYTPAYDDRRCAVPPGREQFLERHRRGSRRHGTGSADRPPGGRELQLELYAGPGRYLSGDSAFARAVPERRERQAKRDRYDRPGDGEQSARPVSLLQFL